jgi:hypothetical protein
MTLGGQEADVAGAGFSEGGSALDLLRSSASQGALTHAVLGQQGLITEARLGTTSRLPRIRRPLRPTLAMLRTMRRRSLTSPARSRVSPPLRACLQALVKSAERQQARWVTQPVLAACTDVPVR